MSYQLIIYGKSRISYIQMNKKASTSAGLGYGRDKEIIRLLPAPEEGVWTAALSGGLRVCRDGEYTETICKDSCYQIMKGKEELADMVLYREEACIKAWPKFNLCNPVTLGRDPDQAIMISGSRYVSRKHMQIIMTDQGPRADIFSMNGIYVNGRRVLQSRDLSFGDRIHVFGFEMIILGEMAAWQCLPFSRAKLSVTLMEEAPETGAGKAKGKEGKDLSAALPGLFHRAPRRMESLDLSPLILKLPAGIQEERPPDLFGSFSSLFTMLVPMLSGTGFMMYTASLTGMGNTIFLLSGIVMTGSGAICTLLAGLMNRQLIKRRNRRVKTETEESFKDYLGEQRQKLRGRYDQIRMVWNNRYAPADTYLLYDRMIRQLWNRNPHHEDFLLCRIGEGNLESPVEIRIPGESAHLEQEEFRKDLYSFRDEFASIAGVPVTIDLRRNDQFGIAGPEKYRTGFLRALIVQLSASHSYTECRMVFFYDRAGSLDPSAWSFVRWLPHVWDRSEKQRYIAWDRESGRSLLKSIGSMIRERSGMDMKGVRSGKQWLPHYILFVINASYIEEDPLYRVITGDIGHLGMTAIWAAETPDLLPNACRHVIYKDDREQGMYDLSAEGDGWQQISLDHAEAERTDHFARCLGGIRLAREGSDGSIPDMVTFFALFRIEKADDLDIGSRWEKNRGSRSLETVIGLRAGGKPCFLDISEKSHGPHGLIAGTTGSGKSEILQTYILSLAVNYSPADISFFLIDYKGGGMSELFADLPHVCGRISNLSSGLVMRSMTSIKSENRRRQKLFLEQKVNHIDAYRQKYDAGLASQPLCHLLIIIDEFAELKKEEPDFMAELISVAQVGRSLGVHLILATQKPGGTVDDKIWSNSRFRICLRVQDRQDSIDMLHSKDAAEIINTGRGIFQVGNNEIYEYFQAGWSGAPSSGEDSKTAVGLVSTDGSLELYSEREKAEHEKRQSQLECVRDKIKSTFSESGLPLPGSLWMEPLPAKVYLEDIVSMPSSNEWEIPVGLFDDPENQCRSLFSLRLPDCGHTMVIGMPVSGKSVFIQTFLFGILKQTKPDDCKVYLIDFSGGSMKAFASMPQVRACGCTDEEDLYEEIFAELDAEAGRRRKAFSGGNFRQYRESGEGSWPLIWLIIDNIGSFRAGTEYRYDSRLERLCREGESVGILLMITGLDLGAAQLPAALRDGCRTRIGFAMKDMFSQSDLFGVLHLPVIPENGIQGRGLARQQGRILEFQTALCLNEDNDYKRYKMIEELSVSRRAACPDGAFPKIYIPPQTLKAEELAALIDESSKGEARGVPVGLLFKDGSPVLLSLETCCFPVIWDQEEWMKRSFDFLVQGIRISGAFRRILVDLRQEYAALQESFRILRDEAEIFETFQELIPEIQKRAAGQERADRIYILIPHLSDLLGIMQTGKYDMEGFFRNVWEKGEGLGICFAGWVSSLEDETLSGRGVYDIFCSHGAGIRQDPEGKCYMNNDIDERIIIPEIEV